MRIGGKPTTRHVGYLGRAEDIVAGRGARAPRAISSRSHGAVAALKTLLDRLKIVETIDAHVPGRADTIASVGQTLALAAIGRACHPTSKRGFAQWAGATTLSQLFGVPIEKLTSPFFWDQMDKVSLKALDEIETQILARAARQFGVKTDLLVYDTTNFFTYIASDNAHCDLPQRGKSKQRRNDLRQLALALLVSRDGGVPLGAHMYRGNLNDVSVFIEAFTKLRERLTAMAVEIEQVTFVYDKGNVSKENQARLEDVDYVTSLVPSASDGTACNGLSRTPARRAKSATRWAPTSPTNCAVTALREYTRPSSRLSVRPLAPPRSPGRHSLPSGSRSATGRSTTSRRRSMPASSAAP